MSLAPELLSPSQEQDQVVVGNLRSDSRRVMPRRLPVLIALALVIAVFTVTIAYFWVPANGGTDQNGYLVTSRLMAQEHTFSFRPASPFQFVGNMMVLIDDGRIFAKYPPGFPMLAAIGRLFAGASGMYWVNPLCAILACIFVFLLFRELLNDFAALIGTLVLAFNPLVLFYANDSNSHASTFLCVTLGFWGLFRWIKGGHAWIGFLGALALGYAATIRYTEALLLLPVLFALGVRWQWNWRAMRSGLLVFAGWLIPVAALAAFCWVSFGAPWKTGYWYCSEDTGFAWKYFVGDPLTPNKVGHWESFLIQINWIGLFIFWPIGLFGLVSLIAAQWRVGIALLLWIVPSGLLYLFYYWAPEGESQLSYLRFFMTIMPALLLSGLWVLQRGLIVQGRHWPHVVGLGLVAALVVTINLLNIMPNMESVYARRIALAETLDHVNAKISAGSALFVGDDGFSNDLDAIGGYSLYDLQLFTNTTFPNLQRVVEDKEKNAEPDPRQRIRLSRSLGLVGTQNEAGQYVPQTNQQLQQEQIALMEKLLRQNQRVFVILRTGQNRELLPPLPAKRIRNAGSCWTSPKMSTLMRPVGGWNINGRGNLKGEPRPPKPVIWTFYEILPASSK